MKPTSHPDLPPRTTPRLALAAIVALAVFLALDSIWLTAMTQRLYRPAIGHLMRDGFDLSAAALFYLLYITGMMCFVVLPARSTRHALLRGALFGLIAYATYDLTNQATLRDWPWRVTLADLAWGTVVTGISCAAAQLVLRRRAWRPARSP